MTGSVLRNEYKYRISLDAARLLQYRFRALLRPDAHAGADGSYRVRSLYFDDADCTAYFDKLSGIQERTKYRIRYYNSDHGYILFERKRKHGEKVEKTSVRIDRAAAASMAAAETPRFGGAAPELLNEYALLARADRLHPTVLVDYDRYAYTLPLGSVRVTLDLGLRTAPFCTDLFSGARAAFPVMDEREGILEVKFDAFLPPQVGLLLKDIPKERIAISKYCHCLGMCSLQ